MGRTPTADWQLSGSIDDAAASSGGIVTAHDGYGTVACVMLRVERGQYARAEVV